MHYTADAEVSSELTIELITATCKTCLLGDGLVS